MNWTTDYKLEMDHPFAEVKEGRQYQENLLSVNIGLSTCE